MQKGYCRVAHITLSDTFDMWSKKFKIWFQSGMTEGASINPKYMIHSLLEHKLRRKLKIMMPLCVVNLEINAVLRTTLCDFQGPLSGLECLSSSGIHKTSATEALANMSLRGAHFTHAGTPALLVQQATCHQRSNKSCK